MSILDAWARRIGRDAAKRAFEEAKPQIRAAVIEAVEPAIRRIVADMYRSNPRFRFIKQMQAELQRVDPKLADKKAFEIARQVLNDNLADEKIAFGDPAYAWDRGGAIDLIHAYEIDYWDEAA